MCTFHYWKDTLPLHQSLAQIYSTVIESLFLQEKHVSTLKIKAQELGRERIVTEAFVTSMKVFQDVFYRESRCRNLEALVSDCYSWNEKCN